ncbi:hypothetical protein PGTUg99_010327 [Puccinia graminis f. sp. tritici]|uniref:Uncharacterized protein n=1 Tax=Puccinia graminis f. sp. tritici TaxID=56615 RepID=A0A5B0NAJ6_PUCGR|nr:hypothetical protein PGTUg99_010327 [Puccinia graminis f. sp. tritici]
MLNAFISTPNSLDYREDARTAVKEGDVLVMTLTGVLYFIDDSHSTLFNSAWTPPFIRLPKEVVGGAHLDSSAFQFHKLSIGSQGFIVKFNVI